MLYLYEAVTLLGLPPKMHAHKPVGEDRHRLRLARDFYVLRLGDLFYLVREALRGLPTRQPCVRARTSERIVVLEELLPAERLEKGGVWSPLTLNSKLLLLP